MDTTNILEKVKEDRKLTDVIYDFFLYAGAVKGKEVYIDIERMEHIGIEKRIKNNNLTDKEKDQLLTFVKETKRKAYLKAINKKIKIEGPPEYLLDHYKDAKGYIEDAFKKGVITGEEKEQLSKKLEETKKYLPACLKALLSLAKDNTLANQAYFLSKAKRCAALLGEDISKDEEEVKASIIEHIKNKVRDEVCCTIPGPQETIHVYKIAKYLNSRTTFFIGIDGARAEEIGINLREIVLSKITTIVKEEVGKDENIEIWINNNESEIIKICEKLGLNKEAEELRAKFEEIKKAKTEEEHKEKLKTLYEVLGQPTTPTIRKTPLTQPLKTKKQNPLQSAKQ